MDSLQVVENGSPLNPPSAPPEIIRITDKFELWLEFETVGGSWAMGNGDPFKVTYSLEGWGANAPEMDFEVSSTLGAGPQHYGYNETKCPVDPNDPNKPLKPGLYHVGAYVTFDTVPDATGFIEGLVIQIR
jgi:hypothetical protein